MKKSYLFTITFFLILLLLLSVLSLKIGSYYISWIDLWHILIGNGSESQNTIVFNIRLVHILGAIVVGGALSLSGTIYQSVFQNSLVSPDILGISSGATLGAAISILLGLSSFFIIIFSTIMGIIAVFIAILIVLVANKDLSILLLVLSGIIVASFFSAIVEIICITQLETGKFPSIMFFLLGSLDHLNLYNSLLLGFLILVIGGILYKLSYSLDIISLGDSEAKLLGLNLNFYRYIYIILPTIICSICVAYTGVIGWVGLVIPHITKMIVGNSHNKLLPLSILIGGCFMLTTDLLSRNLLNVQIPIGIVTSLIGAPFFLMILLQHCRRNNANNK